MKKIIAIVAAILVVTGAWAAGPAAAQDDGDYGPTTTTVGCDEATVTAGDSLECIITDCLSDASIIATIDGEQVGTATTDSDGDAVITITVPDGIEGDATLLIDGCGDVIAAVLAVQAAPDLAFTGSESLPTALIAVALIAFGAVLALGARRYQLAAVRRDG